MFALRTLLERLESLPLPLALLVRRIANAKRAEDRHDAACDLAACALELAAAARVGALLEDAAAWGVELADQGDAEAGLAAQLESLALPSAVRWCAILRQSTRVLAARGDRATIAFGAESPDLSTSRPGAAAVAAFADAAAREGIVRDEAALTARAEGALGFFELVAAYVDEVRSGAGRGADHQGRFAELIAAALSEVLLDPALFAGFGLAVAVRADANANDGGRLTWRRLSGLEGTRGAAVASAASPRIREGELHFVHASGAPVAPLHPFVVYRREDELGREQVGFSSRTARLGDVGPVEGSVERPRVSEVAYVDYVSGQTLVGLDARAALAELLSRVSGRALSPSDANQPSAKATEPGASAEGAPLRIDDYELLRQLGHGPTGVVFEARHATLGRRVAVKVLSPALSADETARDRFRADVRALARCDHPNVARIFTAGDDGGRLFCAMELVDGVDLARASHALAAPAGAGEAELVARWASLFAGAADGLAHVHDAGVVHRSVKPQNLMLTRSPERLVLTGPPSDASDASGGATSRYAAPEQLQRGGAEVDLRADVYGLGASLREAWSGRPMVHGHAEPHLVEQGLAKAPAPLGAAVPGLGVEHEAVLAKALAERRDDRYPTARAFAADLRALAAGDPVSVGRPGLARRALAFTRRRPRAVALSLVLLAASAAGLAYADHVRTRTLYFANVVDRRGVFEGVGEVASPAGRAGTYRVTQRGRRTQRVEYVNSAGTLLVSKTLTVTEYEYGKGGRPTGRVDRDALGRVRRKHVYAHRDGVLQDLTTSPLGLPTAESGDVAMVRFTYAPTGFRARVTFHSDRGAPRPILGAFGYDVRADSRGLVTETTFIGFTGSPATRRDGVAKATMIYDALGNNVEETTLDEDGKPVVQSRGYATLKRKFDARGNVVEQSTLGASAELVLGADGVAGWEASYDERGLMREKRFFGAEREPAASRFGAAMYRSTWDAAGREVERAHFGKGGEPVGVVSGYSILRIAYDARGREIEHSYADENNAPTEIRAGYARARFVYDEHDNELSRELFGKSGAPALGREGFATQRARYDERDLCVEQAYFGVTGERVLAASECAIERMRHDERGNRVEHTCLGVDEKPRTKRSGYASERTTYDEFGRPVEFITLGEAGQPVLARGGYAIMRARYDEHGDPIERAYFGVTGEPTLTRAGYAMWRGKRDERGRIVDHRYYGKAGELTTNREGYACRRVKFDERGNEIESATFDVAGRPVRSARGYAQTRAEYDARGRETSRRYLDEHGAPVPEGLVVKANVAAAEGG